MMARPLRRHHMFSIFVLLILSIFQSKDIMIFHKKSTKNTQALSLFLIIRVNWKKDTFKCELGMRHILLKRIDAHIRMYSRIIPCVNLMSYPDKRIWNFLVPGSTPTNQATLFM